MIMCYVGIVGKRHTGRETAAWLIAHAIEYNIRGKNFSEWNEMYKELVDYVIADPEIIESTAHCTIDTFGGYIIDFVKLFCPVLADFDLSDKSVLESYIIYPTTFEIRAYENQPNVKDPHHYAPQDAYSMLLRDFIIYFADNVIKRGFGKSVWLNVARHSIACGENEYKIFWDVKTNEERKFIKKNGILIKLENSARAQQGGYRDINTVDQDILLNTSGDLKEHGRKFWAIAEYIVNRLDK